MSFLLPILNALQPGQKTSEDKSLYFLNNFSKGKIMPNEIFRPQGVIIVQTNILQDQIQKILAVFQEFGKNNKSEKLAFTIGRIDKEKH